MSLSEHSPPDDELAAYVLGALDAGEALRLETELARSAVLRAELKALREVVALLPYATQPVEPPSRTRRQLFARVDASLEDAPPPTHPLPAAALGAAARPPTRPWQVALLAVLLALLTGVGALSLALQRSVSDLARTNVELAANLAQVQRTLGETQASQQALAAQLATGQRELATVSAGLEASQRELATLSQQLAQERHVFAFVTAPGVATRVLEAKSTDTQARGEMYMYPGDEEMVVLFRGLVPLEQGKVYQFWLANGSGQIPAGPPIRADATGLARLVLKAPREVNAFTTVMLTVEQTGAGPASPSKNVVLEGSL